MPLVLTSTVTKHHLSWDKLLYINRDFPLTIYIYIIQWITKGQEIGNSHSCLWDKVPEGLDLWPLQYGFYFGSSEQLGEEDRRVWGRETGGARWVECLTPFAEEVQYT
jgi:hypothetical protein